MSDRHDEERDPAPGRQVLTGRWGFVLVDGRVVVSKRSLVTALRDERDGRMVQPQVLTDQDEDAHGR